MKESQITKSRGTEFHRFIECNLKNDGEKVELSEYFQKDKIEMIETILKTDIGNVLLLEKEVMHTSLFYKGKIDCLAYYKGNLCLLDWKLSEKDKPELKDMYEYPIQMAAYVGAFLNDPRYDHLNEKDNFRSAVIVNFNSNSGGINIHELNYQQTEYYWYQWLFCLRDFWNKYFLMENQNKIGVR
jgi:genome maintenance exonuclease 1